MAVWALQDAKAKFSELIETAAREGAQVVTKRGVETAVVVPIDEWKRMKEGGKPSMSIKEWLLAPEPRFDWSKVLKRGRFKLRQPPKF